MAKKPDPIPGMPDLSSLSPMSAHQIWLAGLGAVAQAQAQGSKAFETLVNDGLTFQRKGQEEARQRFEEATARLTRMAEGLGEQTAGRMDKLEHVFEERVARALHRLGMPTLQDMADLQARVADLEARLGIGSAAAASASPEKTTGKTAGKTTGKAASKRTASRAPARVGTRPR